MSNINPSLLENVFTVTYRYAPDVSGGTPYYKPLINITNVDSINVNTLTYSNIAFGDAFGNMFVGDQAGANGTNRSNVNGLGEQAVDYSDNIRNVNVLGFSIMNQADDLSNVVGVGTYLGSNMSNVSNSIFLGDFVAGELSNTSGEIFIGTRVAENLVASDGQNIIIGNEGLNTATSIGRGNILMGAGVAGTGLTPGSSNVVIGTGSAPNLTTDASANVILGAASGLNIVNGSNNILIGFEVDPPADTSDYLQIGNLIRGSQSISYVSIMNGLDYTNGCVNLGNNTVIWPSDDPLVVTDLSARLILGPAPNTTNIGYSSVIENITVDGATNYGSKLNFYTHPNALGVPSLAMTIDENQRIGIGTTSPIQKLDVSGVIQARGPFDVRATYESNNQIMALMKYDSGCNCASFVAYNNTPSATSNPPILFQQLTASGGSQNSMYINSSGFVGINTVTPSTRLEVVGTVSSTTFVGNGTIPIGGIIMWSGSIASIPVGWALCDGTSGTPDLRNRFVIGAGSTYAVAASGGSTTIEASNLPKHAHYIVDPGHAHNVVLTNLFNDGESGTGIVYAGQGSGGTAGSRTLDSNAAQTTTTGITISQNGPILDSNYNQTLQTAYLQPYYSLAYIMRTA